MKGNCKQLVFSCLVATLLSILSSGCTDKDYSLSDIDTTVGLCADSIVLPGNNSTEQIYLDEFIDLSKANFIHIDPETFDYMLQAKSANNSITFKNVPKFLQNNSGQICLYDPHVTLTLYSPKEGQEISGDFTAYDEANHAQVKISLPVVTLHKGNNIICVRGKDYQAGGDTITVIVPNLTELVRNIPHSIRFNSDLPSDAEYSIYTPLAFDEDARIVYNDSVVGWNKVMKNLRFLDKRIDGIEADNYIRLTTVVENMLPTYLTVSACGLDVNGDSISTSKLKITANKVIKASPDGVNAAETEISLTARSYEDDILSKVDGVRFHFIAATRDCNGKNPVAGVTINSRYQTVTAHNIRIVVHGKMVGDFN